MDHHEVERLRRSVVMLQPDAWALRREDANRLLLRLAELEHLVAELRARLVELE